MEMTFKLCIFLLVIAVIHTIGGNQSPQWNNFPSTLMVNEDAPKGLMVALLNATDPEDDELEFSVRGGPGGEVLKLMMLNTSEVLAILARPLDRESVEEYNLLFTVSDYQHVVQRWCTLYVLDVNDNRPKFLDTPYVRAISEATPVGTTVYQVSAEDPDTGVWSLVSYALKTKSEHFRVNTARGTVILTKELDFNIQRLFQLEIMAIDGGGLTNSVVLEIRITKATEQISRKTLRCYSCIQNTDCDRYQLSYSPTVICQERQVCFISAREDPWRDFRYRRGCRDMTQCTNGKEICEKNKFGRYECQKCCHTSDCNADMFQPDMLRHAQEVIAKMSSASTVFKADQPGAFLLQLFSVFVVILLTNNRIPL